MRQFGIIGGGLAGLVTATLLGREGHDVVLYEKKEYPFHKVCGEYLSREVGEVLQKTGADLKELGAREINYLEIVSRPGTRWYSQLPLGAWGISRYKLDHHLYQKALEAGVDVRQNSEVRDIKNAGDSFTLSFKGDEKEQVKHLIAGFGKRSRLDKQLGRDFISKRSPYVGVKYHITGIDHPLDTISIFSFPGGYCGLVKIEEDKYCLSYLTRRENLRSAGSIEKMEKNVLYQCPELKSVMENCTTLYDRPEVINEISFEKKNLYSDGIFFCGDSTGMITPLCGNGMAMAVTAGGILAPLLIKMANGDINEKECAAEYKRIWKKHFSERMIYGRLFQEIIFNKTMSSFALGFIKKFPAFGQSLIAKTHG